MENEELKAKLIEKVQQEYDDFIADLKGKTAEEIVNEYCYEKVTKEEMLYKIKDRDYEKEELEALLKTEDILSQCYDEWLSSDGNFNEMLEYPIDNTIELITDDYRQEKRKIKSRESR